MTDASIPTIHVRQVHGLILTTSTPRFKSSQPPYQKEVSLEISASRRTCDVVEIKIINNEVKTGYIPSLNLGDNIYVDKAIVTNLEELEIADKHDVLSLEHNVHMSEMQEFSPSVTSPLTLERLSQGTVDFPVIENKERTNVYNSENVKIHGIQDSYDNANRPHDDNEITSDENDYTHVDSPLIEIRNE
ncbi:hypothetical protein V1477_019427 [Vespula maculifrons]|uniref:Uncharacterized protein n=1 Tax=Vespula maculifrons TaxID=7453 RepID=A0ABD2AT66_VESMC